MSKKKVWTKEERAIASDAIGEGGCRGALGEIFANAYFVEDRLTQDIATRALSQLKGDIEQAQEE